MARSPRTRRPSAPRIRRPASSGSARLQARPMRTPGQGPGGAMAGAGRLGLGGAASLRAAPETPSRPAPDLAPAAQSAVAEASPRASPAREGAQQHGTPANRSEPPAGQAPGERETVARAATAITGAIVEGAADLLAPEPTLAEAGAVIEGEAAEVTEDAPMTASGDASVEVETSGEGAAQEGAAPAAEGAMPGPGGATAPGADAEAPELSPEPSPAQAVGPAARAVSAHAASSASHQPESEATGAAMASSNRPDVTRRRGASARGAAQADEAETGEVDRQSFRQQLRDAIAAAMPPPQSEDDARRLMQEGGEDAARDVQASLGGHTDEATGGLPAAIDEGNQPDPAAMEGGEEVPLQPEAIGEPPRRVSAGPVVPPPSTEAAVDMSSNRANADTLAAENNITDTQLERGNEPEFQATLGARDEAERHNEEGPARLREAEAGDRAGTRERAQGAINAGLGDFHGERAARLTAVAGQQTTTSGLTAARKAEITATLEGIGERTRTDVTKILDDMTEEVGNRFQTAVDEALEDYDDAFDDVRGGILTRVGDFFTGGGDERFERALAAGRRAFERRIDRAIDDIASYVEGQLARARLRVEEGRAEVDRYINEELPEDEQDFADEASQSITADFEALDGEITDRRDTLVSNMVDIYRQGIERRNAREEELRLANRSLWERVYDATVGVVQKVIQFKNMLLGILARAAAVVEAIIQDPIQFLTNLIAGIKAGLEKFMGNIVENLKQALMGWLFGALEGAGLQLPDRFDLQGFLSIILQILGLTKENVRARAVQILGEETVSRIETAVEILRVLFTEGPAGLWRMLLEKLGDIKEVILAEIRSWIITKIIEAGIKWILGLLNPAGAFVKACMMIYDIVVFFIERGQQIIEAVNAIINTLGVIVAGNIGAMANAVEGALNRILPVVISFLASLLGLGGISDKIRNFIEAVQRPVNKAIDWVINKGLALARGIRGLFGGGEQSSETEEEPDDPEKEAQIQAALLAIDEAEARQTDEGGVTREEAEAVANQVRADHPVLSGITVEPEGDHWAFIYRASSSRKKVGAHNAKITFTSDDITRAKIRAFEIVRAQLMQEEGYAEEVEGYREAFRPSDADAAPDSVEVSVGSGRQAFALGDAMAQNYDEHSGSEGVPQSIVVQQGPGEGAHARVAPRQTGVERPNVLVQGGRYSKYPALMGRIMSLAGILKLNAAKLDEVMRLWFTQRRLPDDVPATNDREQVRAARNLRRILSDALAIRMISERMRGRSAVSSTALALFQSSEETQALPEGAAARPEQLRGLTVDSPEGPPGAGPIIRHTEDRATGQTIRDPRPGPSRPTSKRDRQREFDDAMRAHEDAAERQVQFLLDSERGAHISTFEELAQAIAQIIREYLVGEQS